MLDAGVATDALVGRSGLTPLDGTRWAIRPEHLTLGPPGGEGIEGKVGKYTYLGREAHVQVQTPVGVLIVQVSNPGMAATRAAGEAVSVAVAPEALMAFDSDGKRRPARV
jgi:iron(III) transport system ATP-binding protein